MLPRITVIWAISGSNRDAASLRHHRRKRARRALDRKDALAANRTNQADACTVAGQAADLNLRVRGLFAKLASDGLADAFRRVARGAMRPAYGIKIKPAPSTCTSSSTAAPEPVGPDEPSSGSSTFSQMVRPSVSPGRIVSEPISLRF